MTVFYKGMVEPGQVVTQALKAEFGEEAMAKLNVTEEERERISRQVDKLFNNGVEVLNFTNLRVRSCNLIGFECTSPLCSEKSVHITPEKFENGGFTLIENLSNVFRPHYSGGIR